MAMQGLRKQHVGAVALEMAVAFSEMVVMAVAMLVVMLANYLRDGSEKKKQ